MITQTHSQGWNNALYQFGGRCPHPDDHGHSWPREIERHQAITRRIHKLMSELGEPREDAGQDTE
jgi:hypothetical protein